jgi:hypothetical protein
MENDAVVDMQADTDLDESTTDDDLLAATHKGEGITDGTSDTRSDAQGVRAARRLDRGAGRLVRRTGGPESDG